MFAKVEKKVSDQEKTNKLCRYVKQKIGAVTLFLGQQFYQDFLILILSFRRKAQIHQKVWLSWLSIYKSLYSYSKHICNLYNRYYQYIILYSPHWTNSTTRWLCKFTLTDICDLNILLAPGFETTTIWLASSYQDSKGKFYFYTISVDEILNLNRQSNLTEQDLFEN